MTALLSDKPRAAVASALDLRVMICVPCLLVGGTEIHTIALASALLDAGCEVTVCCYHEHDPITVDALRSRGVNVELLDLDRRPAGPGKRVSRSLGLAAALRRCIRRIRPQIVHVQYMTPGVLPIVVARAVGVDAVVATIHVTANHYGRKVWLPRRVAAPLCDAVICVSGVAEQSFFAGVCFFETRSQPLGRRTFTIHNCVDLPTIAAIREAGASSALAARLGLDGGPVIGILGRLDRFKGHDLLLDAFALISDEFPTARLLCVGDGASRADLQTQTQALCLRERVIWTGRMPQADAFAHLMLMDIVAVPSRPCLEGFGLVAAEAMAMGKPVVASDVDGLAEVVGRDGAGVLVPPQDVPALAQALRRLLRDRREQAAIGLAGRIRAQSLFSPEVFAARHVRLYKTIMESKSRGAR